jgi:serine/threonine protein kinase
MTGCFPFATARVADPNYRLLLERKEQPFWSRIHQKMRIDFSEEFRDVFVRMVSSNPKNRCSFEEVIEMAWFKQGEMSCEEYYN